MKAGGRGRLLGGFVGLPAVRELLIDGNCLLLIGRGQGMMREVVESDDETAGAIAGLQYTNVALSIGEVVATRAMGKDEDGKGEVGAATAGGDSEGKGGEERPQAETTVH